MPRNLYKILYILFFIATVLYGAVHIMGIVTPKQLFAVFMFFVCMRVDKGLEFNKFMTLYFIFLAFFGLSSLASGYFINFVIDLLGTYFIAYVAFWSTSILVRKYDEGRLLLYVIIAIGVFDSFVTILQSFYPGISDTILSILRLSNSQDYLTEHNFESRDLFELVMPGMFSSGVYNGYFLLVSGLLSLYFFKKTNRLLTLIPWCIILVALFCVQQRSPLIFFLMLSLFVFFKILLQSEMSGIKRTGLVLVFLVLSVVGFNYGMNFIANTESRISYYGFDSTGRDSIYKNALNYLGDNFFFGGYYRLINEYHFAPHNLILNAFIYGGLIGGLALIALIIRQIKPMVKTIFKKLTNENSILFFTSIGYIAFTLNSLLHNKSIVTGDAMLWMLWAVVYIEYYFKTYKQ